MLRSLRDARDVNLPGFAIFGFDEHRVPGRRRVIDEAPSIRRPGELSHVLKVGTRSAAERRHGPDAYVALGRGIRSPDPEVDQCTIRREIH